MSASKNQQLLGMAHDTYAIDDQTMCRAHSPTPGSLDQDKQASEQARHFLTAMEVSVDQIEELRGSGIILDLPGQTPLLLRKSNHSSGLATYVRVSAMIAPEVDTRSWWDQWSGVILNCGAMVAGGVATAVSCGATPFTAGASTPVCVASWIGTGATAAQCGLAVAKETSPEFSEYIQSDDGEWINYMDLGLDLLSLGVGVASLPGVIKSGTKLMKTAKYAKFLKNADKGKLTKILARLEKLHGDLANFRVYLEKGLKMTNPAQRAALTNNIIKRMLPLVTKQLAREQFIFLTASLSTALSSISSSQGGVGSREWGLLKLVSVGVYQFIEVE